MTGRIGMFLLCLFLVIFAAAPVTSISVDPIVTAIVGLGAAFFLFIAYVLGKDFPNG